MVLSGYRFAGVACGIKKSKRRDVALIVSDRPATAAALFTTNRVKAAPVLVGMRRMKSGKLQAVVANSGNANACTGKRGLRDAEAMCRMAADALGIDPGLVLPSSTGIIGVPLPMDRVAAGIRRAAAELSADGFERAAEAIMTTDRFRKTATATCRIGGKPVRVAGMAKGAGMIAPHMATMLCYVLTDAAVQPGCLRSILRAAADDTFHCVTVDGDMSTNDTLLLLANGAAGNEPVRAGTAAAAALEKSVREVMKTLALKLVEDGEGATKVVEVRVDEARSLAAARQIAFAVARSQLVKTAFFGEDPNFGRILAAVGYAGVPVDPDRIDVLFDGVAVVRRGVGNPAAERQAARVLQRPRFRVRIRLRQGTAGASVWTSDLSHEYVRINSAYRT
ncbi:MAG TPA: bifunctional glutamate N-acetyltransferase/amino-acid acetyltransferase ArgJ [candidate division Zixibacteria bacterium]|nr:bifunctional glutamate N-acetyltransferase/amino-acid acetyltransferase ArgJ [candidate division Zixibacteria bacterium]